MKTQHLIQQTTELRQLMQKAAHVAEDLQARFPELEEPALRAQCSVIRAFIQQACNLEVGLTDMLKSKES
ncbi:MAG: hypothetical protein AAFQ83_02240 [Bacteroidota bacterium]